MLQDKVFAVEPDFINLEKPIQKIILVKLELLVLKFLRHRLDNYNNL